MKYAVFDVDGVVADFEGSLTYRLYQRHGDMAFANRKFYNLKDRYSGQILSDAMSIVSDPHSYSIHMVNPNMDAIALVEEAHERDYEIMFVTSRPPAAHSVTEAWLKKYLHRVNFYLLFTLNKAEKLFDAREHIAFAVDDCPDVVMEMRRVGINTFSWEQQWNEALYPKLFTGTQNIVYVQENEYSDGVYFWNEMEKEQ